MTNRSPRSRTRHLVATVLAAAVLAPAALLTVASGATAAPGLPGDPAAHGYVGLCNEKGQNVTGGSIDARPFIWKAVASQPPPAAYRGKGENAVLNVYQPRPQTAPAYWSGMSMTAASVYSTPARPAVQATYADATLAEIMAIYPPRVNGLLVLRVYWGKANYGLYSANYPTTVVQVVGRSWHVVSGGTVTCSASKGVSIAQLTGVASKKQVTPRAPNAAQVVLSKPGSRRIASRTSPKAGPRNGAAPGGGAAAGPGASTTTAPAAGSVAANSETRRPSPSSTSWVVWALLAVVSALGAALVLALRGRSAPASAVARQDEIEPNVTTRT